MSEQYSDTAASALESFQRQMRLVAQLQQERSRLTATVSVREKRVTVTVNANGVVIETKFSSDVGDLEYEEIAQAVTEAARQAAEEVVRQGQDLARPLLDERARRPKLSDLVEGLPDLEGYIPTEPEVSTAPPGSTERAGVEADEAGPAMVFTDVEEYDHRRDHSGGRSGVSDSGW